jgi:hypothetical protein
MKSPSTAHSTLSDLNDDVGNTVAQRRRRAGVTLAHALSQLSMGLLAVVLFPRLGKCFGDDQLRDVNVVAQKIGDGLVSTGFGEQVAAVSGLCVKHGGARWLKF